MRILRMSVRNTNCFSDGHLAACVIFIAIGVCVMIANAIILLVIFTNKHLSRAMVLCAFLALADEVNYFE